MPGKLKYRLTPFHFASLGFLYVMVKEIEINSRLGDRAELGALLPFIYFFMFLATLVIDLVIQFVFSSVTWKWLYIAEVLVIVLIVIYFMPTIHHTDY